MLKNKLYFGDCLDILRELHNEYPKGFIDLIYIDPPFNSKRDYNILFESLDLTDTKAQKQAFADTWSSISYIDTLNQIQDLNLELYRLLEALDRINTSKSVISYLTMMAIRIYYMQKVLKDTGSFYLHCDPTMSHYLKIVCDLIFWKKNFRNEVIWHYSTGGVSKRHYAKKHDIILFYTKSDNYCFNPEAIKELRTKEVLRRIKSGVPSATRATSEYKLPSDVFIIQALNAMARERLGYPTQKPETLLERIIKASSNEDDLIADFFCGCGTTVAVAQRLKRNWIGVDISHLSIRLVLDRLTNPYKNKEEREKIRDNIIINGFPKDIASAKELAQHTKKGRIKFQDWIVEVMLGGVSNPKKTADGGYDGYLTFYKTEKQKEIVLIEVKSGKLGVKNIREFIQVVDIQKASIGIFVCFEENVTKPMLLEAKKQGYYSEEFHYDKIQIITIEDLLKEKLPQIPESTKGIFEIASKKLEEDNNNITLNFEKTSEE